MALVRECLVRIHFFHLVWIALVSFLLHIHSKRLMLHITTVDCGTLSSDIKVSHPKAADEECKKTAGNRHELHQVRCFCRWYMCVFFFLASFIQTSIAMLLLTFDSILSLGFLANCVLSSYNTSFEHLLHAVIDIIDWTCMSVWVQLFLHYYFSTECTGVCRQLRFV